MSSDNEKDLLRRIKDDPQAFALVYDKYYNAIFSYVYRRLVDYDVAKDVSAETFLKAYQKIGVFEWRNIRISAWLFRIATNEINLYFRHSNYTPVCIDDTLLHLSLPYEEGVETEKAALEKELEENEEFVIIQKQLLCLNIKYQEVIALRFFEKKPIKEISAILNKKEGTIKSLLSRGLEKLRTAVEKNSKS